VGKRNREEVKKRKMTTPLIFLEFIPLTFTQGKEGPPGEDVTRFVDALPKLGDKDKLFFLKNHVGTTILSPHS